MLSKKTIDKILRKYIKEQLGRGYSEDSIKRVMFKCNYSKNHIEELFNGHYRKRRLQNIAIAAVLLLLPMGFLLNMADQNSSQLPTGYLISKENHTEKVNFSNSPPVWSGTMDGFIISGITSVNLSQFITDSDDDLLTFNVGSVPYLNISVVDEIVIFVPGNFSGDFSTIVTAYDGWNLMAKDIDLKVYGNLG